jgi:small-conductance mechanosensitive channel
LLDTARELRENLSNSVPADIPAGVTREELGAARQYLGQFVFSVENEARSRQDIVDARKARAEADAASKQWKGFADPPPYSMLMVDALRESAETLRAKITALDVGRSIAERELEHFQDEMKRADAALRKARDTASSSSPGLAPLNEWRAEMALWAVRSATASAQMIQRRAEAGQEQMLADKENLKLVERKLAAAGKDVEFTAEDLERVRQIERDRIARIDRELTAAVQRALAATRERTDAGKALDTLKALPATSPAKLAAAEARVRAADAAIVTTRFATEVLNTLASVARGTHDFWRLRYEALTAPEASRRRDAVVRLRALVTRLKPFREVADAQLEIIRSAQREQRLKIADTEASSEAARYENAILDSLTQRATSAQMMRDAADRLEHTVSRWLTEVADTDKERPWAERLAAAWATAVNLARRAWDWELFEVEDTVETEGQKLTVSRGVTVGKSIGALLLFIFGYWIAARLARRFEGILVRRFGVEQAQARTVRRWSLAAWGFVLAVITLNLARIPLTVFAFLGGALAIGVGFGTQTIIRNFISGLIVLMERQIRVGDTIEVDGISGTVTEVNLRSSTVESGDGVEAIIPNSSLLEHKVTNSTKSDRKVRRVVKVGVAYGSPVRDVAAMMKECAERHGLVQKTPEPQVLFEDFGDNALQFALYFWIELSPSVSSRVIMSDLRFMIEKRFSEAGIGIAYPQRDIHLTSAQPLQVEITKGSA